VNFVNGTLLSSSYIAADANDAVPVSGKASSCVGYLTCPYGLPRRTNSWQ
jgi:hypothetical protein